MSSSRIALAATLVAGLSVAAANAAESVTTWRCWYEGRGSVVCTVDGINGQAAAIQPTQMPTQTLPAIMQTVRQEPGTLRGRFLIIPLHTVPYDMANVARLAHITVCGTRPDCTMEYLPARPTDGEIADIRARAELH